MSMFFYFLQAHMSNSSRRFDILRWSVGNMCNWFWNWQYLEFEKDEYESFSRWYLYYYVSNFSQQVFQSLQTYFSLFHRWLMSVSFFLIFLFLDRLTTVNIEETSFCQLFSTEYGKVNNGTQCVPINSASEIIAVS